MCRNGNLFSVSPQADTTVSRASQNCLPGNAGNRYFALDAMDPLAAALRNDRDGYRWLLPVNTHAESHTAKSKRTFDGFTYMVHFRQATLHGWTCKLARRFTMRV